MTESALQELPNRIDSAASKAQRGSSTAVDTNDPLFLDHTPGDNYVYLPGTATNRLTAPDEAALDIVGDIDIRVKVAATDYTPAAAQTIIAKRGAAGQVSWELRVETSGVLTFAWSEDGTAVQTVASSVATSLTDKSTKWIQITVDVDNGASNSDFKFYLSDDNTTWTQLGATQNSGAATSIFASTATIEIGAYNTTVTPWAGMFYQAQIYSGIAGTKVLDIDPATDIDTVSDPDAGQTSFTCTSGQTVTVARAASGLTTAVVTRPVMLLDGTDDYLQLPASDTPTSVTATTGKYSAVVLLREHVTAGSNRQILNFNSSGVSGIHLYLGSTDFPTALAYGVTTFGASTSAAAIILSDLVVVGLVVDNGTIAVYDNVSGLDPTTNITGVGAITYESAGRVGSNAYVVNQTFRGEVFATLIFEDIALTEAQLNTLSTKLINGDYV